MDSEPSRRSALKVFGATGLAGIAALLGAKLRGLGVAAKAAVPKTGPTRLAGTLAAKQRGAGATSAAAAEDLYKLSPGWAAWTQPALNVPDGWSEPDRWLPVIENSHDLPYVHNTFSQVDPSRSPHHWVMVIDLRKCIGCQSCVVACKSENNVPVGVYRTWVQVVEVGQWQRDPDGDGPVVLEGGTYVPSVRRFSLPRLCNHCDDPPCVEVCPVEATFKREDGLVLIDYPKASAAGTASRPAPTTRGSSTRSSRPPTNAPSASSVSTGDCCLPA